MNKTIFLKDTDAEALGRTEAFCTSFLNALSERGLSDKVQLVRVADLGVYNRGVACRVLPAGFLYCNIGENDIPEIIGESIVAERPIGRLIAEKASKQFRLVLRNCGAIDPESIEDSIAHGGYEGLARVLAEFSPERVIEEMKTSGLRGRGGAGFPTWLKWDLTRKTPADTRIMICNGDEGDPGAYMDRSVLEGDPHSVIEGMAIAGYAIGASKGYFYIRAEYPLAVERVDRAIKQARSRGLVGNNILGSSFSFDLDIRLGAGAFVCGEETALIASIEGRRGYPHPRPPYPSVKGLWGKPTNINNVETLATVPAIFQKGGAWFAGIGTEGSKGTKVFAITGKVRNSGLVEVPMGMTLREIVFDVGGGVLGGRKIKAIQTGGPSGGVIPEKYFDTPVDYESLQKLGSIMGSGGMIVMDESDCMVDIAKFYLKFCADESCGKCAPCRIGGVQLLKLLEKIADGRGEPEDLEKMRQIAQAMQKASLCGLGQTASNPVLSTLAYFEEEYRAHVAEKRCPAGRCAALSGEKQ